MADLLNVVLGFPVSTDHVSLISNTFTKCEIPAKVLACEQSELPEALQSADVFCGHAKVPVDWESIVAGGRIRWIQSSAAGLDHCLVKPVIDSEVLVTGASVLFSTQVAETATALLFGLIRKMNEFWPAQQEKIFERRPTDQLWGKTVGIVGMGGNGIQIAKCLAPFGARVIGVDYYTDLEWPNCVEKVFAIEDIGDMLEQTDVLILTVGLTPATSRWIDGSKLGKLRPGSYVINVGRGDVLVESDLVAGLESGHLAAAGLDVCETEPLPPTSRLWEHPNVLISPHIGAQSPDRYDMVTHLFCENIKRFTDTPFDAKKMLNLVDKNLGFPHPNHRLQSGQLENWKRQFAKS